MQAQAHEGHATHLANRLQAEEGFLRAHALQEPDAVGFERGERFGEHAPEGVDVEQEHIGGVMTPDARR